MKSVFLVLAMLATSVFTASAQGQANDKGAKIEFAKELHDYGTIPNGSNGTCTFEFKNTGNAPLIISNCVGSCGCTIPEWTKEPIAPGKKGVITVKYDTMRTGSFSKTVTITSNAVNEPSKTISIKGVVEAPVTPEQGK